MLSVEGCEGRVLPTDDRFALYRVFYSGGHPLVFSSVAKCMALSIHPLRTLSVGRWYNNRFLPRNCGDDDELAS